MRRVDWIDDRRERSGGGSVPSGGTTALIGDGCDCVVGGEEGGMAWFSFWEWDPWLGGEGLGVCEPSLISDGRGSNIGIAGVGKVTWAIFS